MATFDKAAIERGAAKQPLYLHIASVLQERIQDGLYPVASLLPAESALTEEFATSRNTVWEAVRLLVERGLVRRRQGAGTIVIAAMPAVSYVQSINKLDDLFANARDTYYALHGIDTVVIDTGTAERIAARPGEQRIRITGMRWTERGGVPISYIESYVPVAFAEHVEHFWDAQMPFYAILERALGRDIDQVSQHIRAVAMPRNIANAFGLAPGAMSLQVTRRYHAGGDILIASINWHRADQFTYEMLIHRHVDADKG